MLFIKLDHVPGARQQSRQNQQNCDKHLLKQSADTPLSFLLQHPSKLRDPGVLILNDLKDLCPH